MTLAMHSNTANNPFLRALQQLAEGDRRVLGLLASSLLATAQSESKLGLLLFEKLLERHALLNPELGDAFDRVMNMASSVGGTWPSTPLGWRCFVLSATANGCPSRQDFGDLGLYLSKELGGSTSSVALHPSVLQPFDAEQLTFADVFSHCALAKAYAEQRSEPAPVNGTTITTKKFCNEPVIATVLVRAYLSDIPRIQKALQSVLARTESLSFSGSHDPNRMPFSMVPSGVFLPWSGLRRLPDNLEAERIFKSLLERCTIAIDKPKQNSKIRLIAQISEGGLRQPYKIDLRVLKSGQNLSRMVAQCHSPFYFEKRMMALGRAYGTAGFSLLT